MCLQGIKCCYLAVQTQCDRGTNDAELQHGTGHAVRRLAWIQVRCFSSLGQTDCTGGAKQLSEPGLSLTCFLLEQAPGWRQLWAAYRPKRPLAQALANDRYRPIAACRPIQDSTVGSEWSRRPVQLLMDHSMAIAATGMYLAQHQQSVS